MSIRLVVETVESRLRQFNSPLSVALIPLLQRSEWEPVEFKLASAIDQKLSFSSSELLLWARGVFEYERPESSIVEKKKTLLIETAKIGINSNAFPFVISLFEFLKLNFRNLDIDECSAETSTNLKFYLSRLYKRQGRYLDSISLISEVKAATSSRRNLQDSRNVLARSLLHFGKASTNLDLRLGMSLTLSRQAELLYRKILASKSRSISCDLVVVDDDGAQKNLAKAVDLVCGLEFDVMKALSGERKAIKERDFQPILAKWGKAAQLEQSLRLSSRSMFRVCGANYLVTEDGKKRRQYLFEFQDLLIELRARNSDFRGLAIRCGQMAEIFMKEGKLDAAEIELRDSIRYAKQVCDWQVLAQNQLRYAELNFAFRRGKNEWLDSIQLAENAACSLVEQTLSLRLSLCKVKASLAAASGNWGDSFSNTREALGHVEFALQSLVADSMQVFFNPVYFRDKVVDNANEKQPVLGEKVYKELIDRAKLANAAAIDWSLLTSEQSSLIKLGQTVSSMQERSKSQLITSRRMIRYGNSQIHRTKTVLSSIHSNLLCDLRREYPQGLIPADVLQTSLENTASHFRKRTTPNQNVLAMSEESFSVLDALRLTNEDFETYRALDPKFDLTITCLDSHNFQIAGHPEEMRIEILSLYTNAVTAMAKQDGELRPRQLSVEVDWVTPKSKRAFGRIRVSDSAGAVEALGLALEKVLENFRAGNSGYRGLDFCVDYFAGELDGELEIIGKEGFSTCLVISIPQSAKVYNQKND